MTDHNHDGEIIETTSRRLTHNNEPRRPGLVFPPTPGRTVHVPIESLLLAGLGITAVVLALAVVDIGSTLTGLVVAASMLCGALLVVAQTIQLAEDRRRHARPRSRGSQGAPKVSEDTSGASPKTTLYGLAPKPNEDLTLDSGSAPWPTHDRHNKPETQSTPSTANGSDQL